ncbi:MAG: hypothetical protein OEU32_05345 [Acidimicrobiia bacterium]|nr:hypothetical protein [Acidimicrobiia bacterium]
MKSICLANLRAGAPARARSVNASVNRLQWLTTVDTTQPKSTTLTGLVHSPEDMAFKPYHQRPKEASAPTRG